MLFFSHKAGSSAGGYPCSQIYFVYSFLSFSVFLSFYAKLKLGDKYRVNL